jgi:hypothetical protein
MAKRTNVHDTEIDSVVQLLRLEDAVKQSEWAWKQVEKRVGAEIARKLREQASKR